MGLPKINAPKYRMTIPSSGKEVEFRPYLVREEKILMMAMEAEDEKQMSTAITDIVEACTFGELNINKLALFDIEYMFSQLRAKSVGEKTKVLIPCSAEGCEEKNEVEINLETDIKVTDLPNNKIELTDNTGIIMKFPSVADYMDIVNSDKTTIDKIFLTVAASIDSIYSGDEMFDSADHSKDELIAFIENLNSDQFNKVKAYLDKSPYAYMNVNFKCSKCGHNNDIELKGLGNFFN